MQVKLSRSAGTALLLSILTILISALAVQAKAPAKNASRPFRFVVYGDTRDGHDVHRTLVAMIVKQNPALVLQTGDLVHRSSEALWKTYDEITLGMRSKIPVYPSRGNHDIGGKGFEERVTAPFTSGNKLYYSFNKENCHFIALAIDEVSDYTERSAQYRWLVEDLKAARNQRKMTFVFFHVPPYSIGAHGSDETVRRILCPLFIQYGVTAVFNGHDHNYYRTVRDGVTYVVSGGGGAPLYPCNTNRGAIPGDKCASVHHFLVCDVSGDTVTMTAIKQDGSTIDRFTTTAR